MKTTERRCRLPAQPTSALPGTPEKIAVMRARKARGEVVFHPQDAKREVKSGGKEVVTHENT